MGADGWLWLCDQIAVIQHICASSVSTRSLVNSFVGNSFAGKLRHLRLKLEAKYIEFELFVDAFRLQLRFRHTLKSWV